MNKGERLRQMIEKSIKKDIVKGLKYDGDKIRMDLLPFIALKEVGKILTFGADKYADDSWQEVKNGERRYLGALLRHLTAVELGEEFDQESGLHHYAHMACNALFLLYLKLKKGE